jgi:hypothetical protein
MIILAVAAIVGAGATGVWAVAQQADRSKADALQAELEKAALTLPEKRREEIGEPAQEVEDDKINWTEMQTELALTRRREVTAEQQTAASRTRPPGMRAVASADYKNVVTKEVNVTRLPLLVPEGGRIAETLKVYSQGDSYSATAEVEDGVSMRMSGSRKKLVVGDAAAAQRRIKAMNGDQPKLPSLDTPYLIARSDSSTDLSFAKFGAGYVLSLMCDDPADARCANDDFILALASQLSLLNPDAEGE